MKANELTIGDLILAQFINGNRYARIAAIAIDCVVVSVSDREYEHDYESIFPIPLTEEILKANGFEYEQRPENCMVFEKETDDIDIILAHYQDTPNKFFTNIEANETEIRKDILTVHELQHALRLCGLDELANNFFKVAL